MDLEWRFQFSAYLSGGDSIMKNIGNPTGDLQLLVAIIMFDSIFGLIRC